MFYLYSIYDHFAFICSASLAENQKWYSYGANMLGPLILPGSVIGQKSYNFKYFLKIVTLNKINDENQGLTIYHSK